jgi:hypothetical protein
MFLVNLWCENRYKSKKLLHARKKPLIMEVHMAKKRSRKGKRVVTTNIKVTTETHREIQVAAKILNMSQSEIISQALHTLLPNLPDDVRKFDELERSASERASITMKNRRN